MFWINLLLLAAGAFGLSCNTQVILNCNTTYPIFYPLCAALFTVLAYLVMRSRLFFKHENELPITFDKKTTLAVIATLTIVVAFVLLYMLNVHLFQLAQIAIGASAFVLSFFYFIPFSFSTKGTRLRDIYWMKHLLVGLNWSLVTVALPCGFHFSFAFLSFFLQVFFLITALSLSFDLRDADLDKLESHRSFLIVKGEYKLKLFIVSLLLGCALTIIFFESSIAEIIMKLILLSIILYFLLSIKPNDQPAKFNVLLESSILLFAVLGLVF